MLLNKDRQSCESWTEAELRVQAVCTVRDTTDEDRESICCAVRHIAESCLTSERRVGNGATTWSLIVADDG